MRENFLSHHNSEVNDKFWNFDFTNELRFNKKKKLSGALQLFNSPVSFYKVKQLQLSDVF